MFSKIWSFSSKDKLELGPMYWPISYFSGMALWTTLDEIAGSTALIDGTQGMDEADEVEEDKAKD